MHGRRGGRRDFITSGIFTSFFLGNRIAGAREKRAHQALGGGSLETALRVFNFCGTHDPLRSEILKIADPILRADERCTFVTLAKDSSFRSWCRKAGLSVLGGPMLGCIGKDGASVWVRTLQPARISVEVEVDGHARIFGPAETSVASDLSAVIRVSGLRPGRRYPYRVLVDGKAVPMPAEAAIRTVPDSGDKVRIAFGSCSHRWGLGHPTLWNSIRARNPSAMLLIGDVAVQDRRNHLGLHRFDFLMRDLFAPWQGLAANVPLYVGWDDHDYIDNDESGIPAGFSGEDRRGIREVFTQNWNNPAYGTSGNGVFLRTRIGPCDVIMTDNRYFRKPGMGKDHFLGSEQMEWLKRQLLDCKGPFIILSSGTMWSDYVSNGKDSWGKYDPQGREEIFKLIEEHRMPGVLLISGDRHGARGFTIPRENGFAFHEFNGACLGGRSGPPARHPSWVSQLYGSSGKFAFSEFEFDAGKPDPEVTLRLMDANGGELHKVMLKRSQLTPLPQ